MHDANQRLLIATLSGDIPAATAAIADGASVDSRDPQDHTVLMLACGRGDRAMAAALLGAGASPNRRTSDTEETALHQLARDHSESAVPLVQLLLQNDVRLDRLDRFGWTALMIAAREGTLDVARLLIDAGADRSIQSPDGRTAGTLASEAGHTALADLLA